jgi:hypothetical protein
MLAEFRSPGIVPNSFEAASMKRLKKADFKFLVNSVKKRIAKAKKKGKKIRFNLTENYIRKQYETQNGLCPCCGIRLDLKGKTHTPGTPPEMRASVDRVAPTDGYIKGNVALLHQCCNRFKGQLDGNTMYAIAKRIVERFESTYPNVTVKLDTALVENNGRQYVFPRYSFVASGGITIGGSAKCTVKPNHSDQEPSAPPLVEPN